MSDNAQQSILRELERLLPYIRRLEIENKAVADEKAATTEAAIGEQLAKVLARDAALQRETEQQRAARERVAAAEAAPIIEAIQAATQTAGDSMASIIDRLAALPNLHKATLRKAGFQDPDDALLRAAHYLGSSAKKPKNASVVVAKHIKKLHAESLAAADLAATLPEPAVATPDDLGLAVEEFKTPTAQRVRGSGVKRQRGGRAQSPLDLLERIHGEILAGNHPLAAETLRLGTNAVRTLVRRGELAADEGKMIVAELHAAAAI